MKKAVLIIVAILAIAVLCLPAELSFPAKIVPAEAKWAVHLDVKVFVKGQLYKMMEKEDAFRRIRIGRDALSGILGGIDLAKAIDGVTVIGTGPGDKAVVCIEGDLPRDRLIDLAKAEKGYKKTPFGATDIHTWGGGEHGAFSGSRLTLLSEDAAALKEVLGVIGGKTPSLKSEDILSRIKSQSPDTTVVGFVRDVSGLVGGKEGPAIFKVIRSAVFQGSEKGNQMLFGLHIDTPTPADAGELQKILNGLLALAILEKRQGASLFDFVLQDISVNAKDSRVDVSLSYPLESFKKLILGQGPLGGFGSFAGLRAPF